MPPRPRLVPLRLMEEEVAMTWPVALVLRSEFGSPRVRLVVEAVPKKPSPEVVNTEVEALVKLASPVNHEAPDTESKEVEALMKLVLPVKELTPEKVLLLESKVVEARDGNARTEGDAVNGA